jgi:hypothetical protein
MPAGALYLPLRPPFAFSFFSSPINRHIAGQRQTTMTDNFTKQFNQLVNERDQLNTAASAAERERRREEQLLSSHRSAAQQVADQLRLSQSEDGEATRKLQNLHDGKLRLKNQIEADRAEIVKVTNELKGKESEEKKQKWNFVREMESINDELDDLLGKEENEKTLRLIDADTVQWLVETKLSTLNRSDGMDEDYVEAENEKWREIKGKIEEASSALVEARERVEAEKREKMEMEKKLLGLRQQFLAVHPVSFF